MSTHLRRFNISLAWAGNRIQANDRNRSAVLARLQAMERMPDTAIFSRQKGAATAQIQESDLDLIDMTSDINDFSDTAAIIANLDVVVSVCTSVAHVAGAMAKPVIAMLCFN